MSVNLLRSVSVIALSASLAMPAPIVAQTQSETPAAEACPDGSVPVMQEGADAPTCPPDAVAAEAAEAGEAPADTAEGTAAAAETEEPAAGQGADTAEAPAASEGEAAPEAEASASAETEAEAASEAEAAPEVIEQSEEAADAPASEQDAAPEEAQQAEEVAPSAAQQEEQQATEAEEQPVDQQTSEADAQPAEQQAAEEEQPAEQTMTEAENQPVAEEAPASEEAVEETASDSDASDEPTESTESASDAEAAEEPAESDTTQPTEAEATAMTEGDASAEAPDAEVAQEDTAETTAEANEPVATEAATAAEDAMLESTEGDTVETVTEETARSSSEEFATTAAPAQQDDGGLSNLEIFALSALGGAAAAALLGQNEEVVVSSEDRLVVQDGSGNYRVLKNDDELLRRPGVEVATREFSDGSTRTLVTREDGVRVVTIRAPNGQVLKRTRILPDGREILLFDDTVDVEPVDMAFLEQFRPQERVVDTRNARDADALRAALQSVENPTDRGFSLQQIRQIRAVRDLVPEIDLDEVNFESGSAVIRPEEAQDLSAIGKAIAAAIDENPNEVYLIEGHTDATGGAAMNLALSDRRAESAALALTEYFDIPPENLVVQGYGESNLKVRTNEAERANRRVAVRRITPLLYARR